MDVNEDSDDETFVIELSTIDEQIAQVNRAIEKLETKKTMLEAQRESLKQNRQQQISNKLSNLDWERMDHPWSNRATECLKKDFKLSSFRPHQISAINAVMSKQDCILLMPTGGGKSLCYQLPALLSSGTTLVVSPLISLMEDQILALEALSIPATLLNASSTREHVNKTQRDMTEKGSALKLLYVTPEKLAKSKRFMAKLEKMYQIGNFSLLAIDEVHCCSQWGNDFRPDYKFLGIMKRQFPNVPILGLTATATSKVISDVQKILNIETSLVLKASFNRPNLRYEVCFSSQKESVDDLVNLLKGKFCGLSGIIYCFSIKESEDIASELRKRSISARSYHAQLDAKTRSSVHKSWINNHVQVIVATVAFGMGIDKPDVRFVIHNSLAKSMENFYQESGRAGRDGELAHCILFYRFSDLFRQSTMVFTERTGLENLYSMVAYCLDISRCRRSIIAQHFGECWERSDCRAMCDHCDRKGPYQEAQKDVTTDCLCLYSILDHCSLKEERLTALKLIEAWSGKGPPKLRPPNLTPCIYSREKCERIIAHLLLERYLKEEFHFTPYSTISYINQGPKASAVKNGKLTITVTLRTVPLNITSDIHAKTESSSSSSVKKMKDNNSKPKVCFVNNDKSHFNSGVASNAEKRKSSENYPAKKKSKLEEKKTTYPEVISVIDDDGLDFGELKSKPNLLGKRKRKDTPVLVISDSD